MYDIHTDIYRIHKVYINIYRKIYRVFFQIYSVYNIMKYIFIVINRPDIRFME